MSKIGYLLSMILLACASGLVQAKTPSTTTHTPGARLTNKELGRHPALPQFIKTDSQNNYRADDDLLPIRICAQQVAAIREQAHNEGADERPQYAALAASQAPAADDDRGNGLQLVT